MFNPRFSFRCGSVVGGPTGCRNVGQNERLGSLVILTDVPGARVSVGGDGNVAARVILAREWRDDERPDPNRVLVLPVRV